MNSFPLNQYLAHTYNLGNGINFGNGFVQVTQLGDLRSLNLLKGLSLTKLIFFSLDCFALFWDFRYLLLDC